MTGSAFLAMTTIWALCNREWIIGRDCTLFRAHCSLVLALKLSVQLQTNCFTVSKVLLWINSISPRRLHGKSLSRILYSLSPDSSIIRKVFGAVQWLFPESWRLNFQFPVGRKINTSCMDFSLKSEPAKVWNCSSSSGAIVRHHWFLCLKTATFSSSSVLKFIKFLKCHGSRTRQGQAWRGDGPHAGPSWWGVGMVCGSGIVSSTRYRRWNRLLLWGLLHGVLDVLQGR